MKTADELFDGSNAHLLGKSAVHPSGYGVVGDCKMAVIRSAFGIQALSEPELLKRLEDLYLQGLEVGFSLGQPPQWRKEPPDEQCYWWWWNQDGPPVPVSILFSGTENRYFAAPGQHGWNRFQWVEDMGGMWMRLPEPETP